MSYHYYPAVHYDPAVNTAQRNISLPGPHAVLAMGGLGAIGGGTAAAARNIRRIRQGTISREEAVLDTLKESAGAGIASAAATFVVGSLGTRGFLGLLGAVTVATGTRYLWDSAMAGETAGPDCPAEPAESGKTAKTTRTGTKKTTT
jgi:hypothetical protein